MKVNHTTFTPTHTDPMPNKGTSDEQWYQAFCQEVDKTAKIIGYLSEEQVKRFRKACFFMYEEHKAQRRRSGEPYAFHPLAVAAILSEVKFDADTLIAGLLHDVIEDVKNPDGSKKWSNETLAAVPFVGKVVAQIVEGVTKIEKIDHLTPDPTTKERREARTIVKTILATSQDIRVIMVKLADRLHNLRTMAAMKPSSQRKKARETLAVYAPIAARLGMETLRLRLTELSYQYAYPRLFQRAKEYLDEQKPKLKVSNEELADELYEQLKSHGIGVNRVAVREPLVQHALIDLKRYGSVEAIEYRRLLRVVVDTEDDCYRALGVLHKRFGHVNRNIMDYISQPKEKVYRSLDTQLFGQKGGLYDCVIRTEEMHTRAQTGAAGAFLRNYYATEGSVPDSFSQHYAKWFHQLVEIEKSLDTHAEFYTEFKEELQPNEIAVHTPKGERVDLPRGATPIDFAYKIHTALGNAAERALVNGQYTSLNYQLRDGDHVRIIRSDTARPNPTWVRFVKTPKARSEIRLYFKRLNEERALKHGKEHLVTLLHQFDLPLPDTWDEAILAKLLKKYKDVNSLTDLYLSIGRGNSLPSNIVYDFKRLLVKQNLDETPPLDNTPKTEFNQSKLFGDLATPCEHCMPIPGDDVVVLHSKGKGMVIHHAKCALTQDRGIDQKKVHYFRWQKTDIRQQAHLIFTVIDKPGVLADICQVIADKDSNISRANVIELDGQNSKIDILLKVFDLEQLTAITSNLQRLRNIILIERQNYSTKQ